MKNTWLKTALVALMVSMATLGLYHWLAPQRGRTVAIEHVAPSSAKRTVLTVNDKGELAPLDFTQTARKVVEGVVHIKSTKTLERRGDARRDMQPQIPEFFRDFFDDDDPFFRFETPRNQGPQTRVGSGSGVIINEEGYIVTNNHVIANADDIELRLHDNRTFKATVVGTDPNTDLALLRIQAEELPTIPLTDSDEVEVGEWVMAVGNPLGLNSTVTAGIVSAKARNINILQEQYAVESFIQTDAAINPGNSGGALVNLDGALVGINTAIASPTGVYAGYGFAVPSNIVRKVVQDLLEYGVVQRGVLGVMIRSVDGNLAREEDLDVSKGVYVDSLLEQSAAGEAGVQVGDVIVALDGKAVKSSPELQELIARKRPGDVVKVTVKRNSRELTIPVTLRNRRGETDLVKKEQRDVLEILGAEFEKLSEASARKLDIPGGVRVTKLYAGKLRRYTNMREGFVITKIDGQPVTSVEELAAALEKKSGGIMMEGVYEDIPGVHYYAFGL